MPGRLEGQVAIITGGTSGIGKRTAEIFAQEGASVVIAARREEEGQNIANALGEKVAFIKTDVAKEHDIQNMIQFAVDKFGRLDCLFNNAGGPAPLGGIEDIPLEGYEAAISVLLGGVLLGMKHAAPVMKAQKSGSIINNGSIAGILSGYSSSIIYSTAKAAVIHLTKIVGMELGEHNIRVNCISPGGIPTGIFGKAAGLPDNEADETSEKMAELMGNNKNTPIPRAGMTDDIAYAAVFLASAEGSFINSHNLVVDGGVMGGRPWTAQQEGRARLHNTLVEHAKS